jgi:hypothetical protein
MKNNKCKNNYEKKGHDGPEIAHQNIKTLHDKEQVNYKLNLKLISQSSYLFLK